MAHPHHQQLINIPIVASWLLLLLVQISSGALNERTFAKIEVLTSRRRPLYPTRLDQLKAAWPFTVENLGQTVLVANFGTRQ